jgi:hypothetical protein
MVSARSRAGKSPPMPPVAFCLASLFPGLPRGTAVERSHEWAYEPFETLYGERSVSMRSTPAGQQPRSQKRALQQQIEAPREAPEPTGDVRISDPVPFRVGLEVMQYGITRL